VRRERQREREREREAEEESSPGQRAALEELRPKFPKSARSMMERMPAIRFDMKFPRMDQWTAHVKSGSITLLCTSVHNLSDDTLRFLTLSRGRRQPHKRPAFEKCSGKRSTNTCRKTTVKQRKPTSFSVSYPLYKFIVDRLDSSTKVPERLFDGLSLKHLTGRCNRTLFVLRNFFFFFFFHPHTLQVKIEE